VDRTVYVESVASEELPHHRALLGGVPHDANNIFNHPVMGFNYTQGNTCIDCAGPLAPLSRGMPARSPTSKITRRCGCSHLG